MHKQGWLSGSLYLNLQKDPGSRQGNIVFDLDGGSYPKNGKTFSHKEFNIEKGDIVLFPSSIFHKTVPFESQEHRVTLAFDVKPVFI
jgi:ectoine hydroxylase-related dioxygenase (phytanoyl-CoA dioxygenase family)